MRTLLQVVGVESPAGHALPEILPQLTGNQVVFRQAQLHLVAAQPGGAINGLRVRMHDKLARINNLYDSIRDMAPEHESFEDSFKDMANYAIIGLLVLRGQWDK